MILSETRRTGRRREPRTTEQIRGWWLSQPRRSRRAWELAWLLAVPITVELTLLGVAWERRALGIDMKLSLLPAADLIRAGVAPFTRTHYPPLIPVALVPFTFLPSPEVILALLAVAAVPATLWALDVHDWRCYGATFLWAPIFSGIQTANATVFLALASALAWRYRDRTWASATAAGLAVSAKLISWPLVVWLGATGRARAAVGSVLVALASSIGLGLLLELTLRHADTKLGEIAGSSESPSYSIIDVSRSLGAETWMGLVLLAAFGLALAALVVVVGRRGDDTRAFCLACLGSLVGAPNIWLHTFAFLLPIVALTRPRFSGMWLVPVLFVLVPVEEPIGVEVAVAWMLVGFIAFRLLGRPMCRTSPRVAHGSMSSA